MVRTHKEGVKTPLRKAVDYLISIGKLEQDKDLAEKYGLTQGTVSAYLSGTPGKDFVKNVQRDFEINLNDFEKGSAPIKKELTENEEVSIQTLYKLANANEKLADANQRLTIMLQKNDITVSVGQQSLEVSDTMMEGLLVLLRDVSEGKKFESRKEALTAIHNAMHGSFQTAPAKDTQKG